MFNFNTNFPQANLLIDLKEAWDAFRYVISKSNNFSHAFWCSLVGTQYCNVQNVLNIYAETKSETEDGEMNS